MAKRFAGRYAILAVDQCSIAAYRNQVSLMGGLFNMRIKHTTHLWLPKVSSIRTYGADRGNFCHLAANIK